MGRGAVPLPGKPQCVGGNFARLTKRRARGITPANSVECGQVMDCDREVEPLLTMAVSVDYPGRRGVLDDVRFTMARGEIAGLVGASGSGKSTLALTIPRLIALRGGTIHGSIRF